MTNSRPCYCRQNSWKTRNNSEGVAAVLNPKNHKSPKRNQKHNFTDNTCYCREKKVKPKLFLRPKNCIYLEDCDEKDSQLDHIPAFRKPDTRPYCSRCWQEPQDFTTSTTKKNFASSALPTVRVPEKDSVFGRCNLTSGNGFLAGGFVPKLQVSREQLKNYLEKKRSTCYNLTEPEEIGKGADDEFTENVRSKVSNLSVNEDGPSSAKRDFPGNDLKQLSTFRNDHYFETHSTENLLKTIPEHVCVHRFALDERFAAEALKADAYGESRCLICDKPMEPPKPNQTDERTLPYTESKTFPKFYRYGLAPKKIYMANEHNLQVEMMLEDLKNEGCLGGNYAGRRPNYFNTYALRYQKGVK